MKSRCYIGAHVSTRGGFYKAAQRARETGALSFQYFPKNPRSLALKTLDPSDAEECRAYCEMHHLKSIAHSPYPVNPAAGASRGEEGYELMVASLLNDLAIAEACGSVGIVVHFGHLRSNDPLEGYKNMISCLDAVLSRWTGNAKILIENQAGDHGPMGTTLEEMVQIRSLSRHGERIGFCLDTCHAFAAGLWNGGTDETLLEKGEKLGYWSALCAVHLNDSRYPAGERKDRHARIGTGYIGEQGFRWLLKQHPFHHIPLVMETEPGEDGTHREDIRKVLEWC
ncbi:deoxyribonuclease IV [Paenibacillus sp. P96]|uniref:Deoxyribonuclease IV n=1 Tax=Paenibacillus zeirhizosphaerae TaxID=2987519 RepID=A0ABT9FV67_9BACL|nr:deoxyribonuclease IV [Paenibacillus sp. P96]MDP4098624.1 deoxyribonuclease IV [Paenibacillus sp. P96]